MQLDTCLSAAFPVFSKFLIAKIVRQISHPVQLEKSYKNMEDFEIAEDEQILARPARVPCFYVKVDPLSVYSDGQFRLRYAMSKESFQNLLDTVQPMLEKFSRRGQPIPPHVQLLATLRYYREGCFQRATGDLVGLPQSSISKDVARTSRAIANLAKTVIKFPTGEKLALAKRQFYELMPNRLDGNRGMPNVVGCIDGCQVEVAANGVANREDYRNRKGVLAINVQAVCDANLVFTNVVARWPGSVHDSRVFQMSELCSQFENGLIDGLLLGDAGYPLTRYLMTPYRDPQTAGQRSYNYHHIGNCVRNCIERSFGVLKRRWPIVAAANRQKLANAVATTLACFVLHNFLRLAGDFEVEDPNGLAIGTHLAHDIGHTSNSTRDGERVRSQLVDTYFS